MSMSRPGSLDYERVSGIIHTPSYVGVRIACYMARRRQNLQRLIITKRARLTIRLFICLELTEDSMT